MYMRKIVKICICIYYDNIINLSINQLRTSLLTVGIDVVPLINNRICSIVSVTSKYVEIRRISTSCSRVLGREEEEKMRTGDKGCCCLIKDKASLRLDYFIHFLLSFCRVCTIIIYSISMRIIRARKKKTWGLITEGTKRGLVVFFSFYYSRKLAITTNNNNNNCFVLF